MTLAISITRIVLPLLLSMVESVGLLTLFDGRFSRQTRQTLLPLAVVILANVQYGVLLLHMGSLRFDSDRWMAWMMVFFPISMIWSLVIEAMIEHLQER